MNLAELQRNNARTRGGEPAVTDAYGTLTHAELDERIRRTAAQLARLGVATGDLIGVNLVDGGETLVVWLALARLGAAFIPMDWRWTAEEQKQIGEVFRPKLVIVEPGRRIAPGLPAVPLDDAWDAALADMPAEDRMAPGDDAPLIMNMTSGTTGLPKGNVHTHRTYRALLRAHWIDIGQGSADRTLAVLPLASAAGRSVVLATLLAGGRVIFAPPLLEPRELVGLCAREGITTLCIVPAIVRGLLALANGPGLLLPTLTCLASVGAMLFPEESRAVRERLSPHLINYYGSTGGGINTMLYPDEIERKPGSVGRPALGTELEVVDDAGNRLPRGETGRLRLRCPSTCRGIYPPDPADRSYFEGWHYPGDYALIDADGYLFLQGRYNDIIIRGGSNVYAPEVERVLLALPGVVEAAVLGLPHPTLGEDVAAFVVVDAGVDEAAIVRHCRGRLAAYKVPSKIRILEALPRNSAGKVLKRRLLEAAS